MLRLAGTADTAIDPLDLYLSDQRVAHGRPWVVVNMISSIDGVTVVDGGSTALGDADDKAVFRALRAVPDVILVGAGTVRAENYSPVRLDEERRKARSGLGMAEVPTLAIVSGQLSLDATHPVFSDSDYKPMVLTSTSVDPAKLVTLGDAADVAFLAELDPGSILEQLGAAKVVLLEGGPSLNGHFARAGLIDELNITLAPSLYGGESPRIIGGGELASSFDMRLDRVLIGDRSLFLRYLRA